MTAVDDGELLDGFTAFAASQGLELYDHQLEAILELYSGNHVILNTPTGSGKSLVGAAVHYASLQRGQRSYYTAPIKALVSEKFFALSRDFGADNVGMVTGDASINHDAPIICCTAEILANLALREGHRAHVDQAVVDEFHYYADPQRGWAWQVPLLELPQTQFCLMSATLGPTRSFEDDLTQRTKRPAVTVSSAQRPVPLNFEYRHTSLHESLTELLELERAPVYIVHFTQREATEAAQSYLSLDPLTRDEKEQVRRAVGGFRFDTPIGKDMRRWISGGVGVHHAGLLPKYRLLVEKLAQDGLLKVICGTDTLGVGVNVPIRTVLFTQLCKYDGQQNRLLTNREFKQIAGRAGRKGFDTEGFVWVQAPPHVIDNAKAEEKAARSGSKKRPVRKRPPDKGYSHWTEDTYRRMVHGEPEPLTSQFEVSHQMILNVLDRPGDGCGDLRRLLRDNHETQRRRRNHQRQAIRMYRSLRDADLLEFPDEPDHLGRRVRVTFDVQEEFALHQPLSLWAIEAMDDLPTTDGGDDGTPHHLRVLTIVEAVQESPGVVLAAQLHRAKSELMAEMKRSGVEYEERLERLAEVRPPQPDRDWIYDHFDRWRLHHPYVGQNNPKPKSIVREMLTEAMTIVEYINHHGLKRSEGVLLRYLSDVYKGLIQNVPADVRTDEIDEIVDWLGVVIRTVDSSLIDEWERLRDPDEAIAAPAPPPPSVPFTQTRAFAVLVRNRMWKFVEDLAFYRPGNLPLDAAEERFAPYWDEHDVVLLDSDARSPHKLFWDPTTGRVEQIVSDPEGYDDWRLTAEVDLDGSDRSGEVILTLTDLAQS